MRTMKKITSKQEKSRKKNRNQLIVGLILIGVMLFSVIGYSFQGSGGNVNKKIKYNGFEFIKQGDFWVLNINNNNFVFKYNPEEVEKINEYLTPLNGYYDQPLYIFSESNAAELEIYRNLNLFVQRIQKACPEGEKNCGENDPFKTCKDNFIIIKESNSSKIYQEENCVFIEGKQEDLVKLSDGFLFKIFGIK